MKCEGLSIIDQLHLMYCSNLAYSLAKDLVASILQKITLFTHFLFQSQRLCTGLPLGSVL